MHKDKTVMLPVKATRKSAGYDFFAPEEYRFKPKEKHLFWTDVKVHLQADEILQVTPRSSMGIQRSLMLANTVGTIDPDYCGNQANDGNIGICMYNYGVEPVSIEAGERFAQGVVVKVVNEVDEGNTAERTGGIGSTGA